MGFIILIIFFNSETFLVMEYVRSTIKTQKTLRYLQAYLVYRFVFHVLRISNKTQPPQSARCALCTFLATGLRISKSTVGVRFPVSSRKRNLLNLATQRAPRRGIVIENS